MNKLIKRLNLILFPLLCAAIITSCTGTGSPDSSLTKPVSKEAQAILNEKIPTPKPEPDISDEAGEENKSEAEFAEEQITVTEQTSTPKQELIDKQATKPTSLVAQGEAYYDLEHVVLYLDAFGTLPPNYITKKEAQALGWEGGTVEDFQEGAAIGGTYYGNYEGTLPKGCEYHECDLDTHPHKKRGAKRLVYSDDGRYYYTDDHYEHFREVTITDGQVTIN